MSLPLVLLSAIAIINALDERSASLIQSHVSPRYRLSVGYPTACLAFGLVVLLAPGPLSLLWHVPGRLHASAPTPPPTDVPRLGYTTPGSVDLAQIVDLRNLLNTYAGPQQPVFDFANELGVLYYLLSRRPGTRFFHVSMAITAASQRDLISDLQASRPPVVIYTDSLFGLPSWDGVINPVRHYEVSQYLLDHYSPLVDIGGQLLLLRDDLPHHTNNLPFLTERPVTTGLYFAGPSCTWGDIPNFLDPPSAQARRQAVRAYLKPLPDTAIRGWAVSARNGKPVAQVVAVASGRVIASAVPNIARPDVVTARRLVDAKVSGFSLALPPGSPMSVGIYAIAADGTASILPGPTGAISSEATRHITTLDGRAHLVVHGSAEGAVDAFVTSVSNVFALQVSATTNLSAYEWLAIDTARPLGNDQLMIADHDSSHAGHIITLTTLPRSGMQVDVRVGSCLQWHGYRPQDVIVTATNPITPTAAYLMP